VYQWLFAYPGAVVVFLAILLLDSDIDPFGSIGLSWFSWLSIRDVGARCLAIALIFFGFGCMPFSKKWSYIFIGAAIYCIVITDPVQTLFNGLAVVINGLTFNMHSEVLWGAEYSKTILFGMLLFNTRFRDTAKYTGATSVISSWIVGSTMIAATIEHGVWTGFCLKLVYEIEHLLVLLGIKKTQSESHKT